MMRSGKNMSKQVQTGVTFNRNDRTPLDNETVMSKYSDIEDITGFCTIVSNR